MGDYGFVRARNAKRGQQISVLAQGAKNAPDIGALSKASDPKQNLNEFEQKKCIYQGFIFKVYTSKLQVYI